MGSQGGDESGMNVYCGICGVRYPITRDEPNRRWVVHPECRCWDEYETMKNMLVTIANAPVIRHRSWTAVEEDQKNTSKMASSALPR